MTADGGISACTAAAYTVPTPEQEADGTGRWSATTVVVVRIEAQGREGQGWSYTEAAAAAVVTDVLAPVLAGADPDDLPALRHAMLVRLRNAGVTGIAAAALSAVDVALWDLKARRMDSPLADLLGRARDTAPIYGSGGFVSYDDGTTIAELEHWLDLGAAAVKIKIGESFGGEADRDLARVSLARGVVGGAVQVFVDANGGYSVKRAVRMGHMMRELDVRWFEEPVSSDFPARLAEVRRQTAVDVAAGEYVWRVADAAALLAADAVDCLQLDVTRCGGYSGFLECAAMAAGRGLEVSVHCGPHLALPVALAVPNLRHVEYFVDHERVDAALFDGLPDVVAGALVPAEVAGHGMRVRAGADRFRVA